MVCIKMDYIKEIKELKKKKNAIILTHCYQNIEIDEVADFVGDSFYLSKIAQKTNADIIVFAGVFFMAQSAKLLNPDKKVLLPNMKSGCLMADMINADLLKEFKKEYPELPVVCYINSTAEVKAESDICCTSSNAVDIVKKLNKKEILFVPDTYLGKWAEKQLKDVTIHTYTGYCPTHLRVKAEDIEKARENYPYAKILAHPECHTSVTDIVDFVGSTKEITEYVKNTNFKEYVIATEKGVLDRLKRDYKDKKFYLASEKLICPNMKQNSLEDIYNVLLNETNEINIDKSVREKAMNCINRMFV